MIIERPETVLLVGKTDYLSTLRPVLDPVYSGEKISNDFVDFVQETMRRCSRREVLTLVKNFTKDASRKGKTKKEIFRDLRPFIKWRKSREHKFNGRLLSRQLMGIIIYRHMNSIVFAEKVSQ